MNKSPGFLQGSKGEMSSKRLAFIFSMPFLVVGTLSICNKLIKVGRPELAVDLWTCFFWFVAGLGGLVTSELLIRFLKFKTKK